MKRFVDYRSRKCFASACVAAAARRLGYAVPLTLAKSFSGLVIQITIVYQGQKVHLSSSQSGFSRRSAAET
jgi:hypothetical protein